MIENLAIEIFYLLMIVFGTIVAIGVISRQGIFLMFAGVFLLVIWLPIDSVAYGDERLMNSTVTGNVTTNAYDRDTIPFDFGVKALMTLFSGLVIAFGFWVWRGDN